MEESGVFLCHTSIDYAGVSAQEQETRARIEASAKTGVDAFHKKNGSAQRCDDPFQTRSPEISSAATR
ncbi:MULTISPECIES: hypothetical protein [Burkholderia]|nr:MULTISPECIES: hypothetical protein [Burkholderia]KGS04412.1 hypothetical protein X946_2827 [Burkholderia sp. ABCPW 111]